MSANSSVTGISAPVTPDSRNPLMQRLQIAGLPGNRLKPKCFRTIPPAPPNGAAQSLQRGEVGIRFMVLRMATRSLFSPVSMDLNSASVGAGMARLYDVMNVPPSTPRHSG
jgi:hypothetical protein